MHLKALEIQGFKSFPDKTVLQFDAGITAVVGPNGSGKSNISDAVRWVMGEQSTRALRGGKMEDVIFGGTEQRKRHGFAEVSLTLDNEDQSLPLEESEVTVTRRYYRSGESEYYINRRLCRLRDINELFMDTGLGQEGYALIGQGKIDEILAVKSTQRREVFEEAAGISRYRHRKDEAERKLQSTRENLLRVTDKLEELNLQLGPLQQQAEKARRYFLCRDELRTLEVSLWMERLSNLRLEQETLRTAFLEAQARLQEVQARHNGLYEQTEILREAVSQKDVQMERARLALSAIEERSARMGQNLSVLRVQMENGKTERLRLQTEQTQQAQEEAALYASQEEQETEKSRRQEEEEQVRQTLLHLEEALRQAEEACHSARLALRQLAETKKQETQSAGRVESLLAALGATGEEIAAREESLHSARQAAEQDAQALDAALSALSVEEATQRVRLQETMAALKEQEQEQERLRVQEEVCQKQLLALRMEENSKRARLRVLEEMERHYEGYSKSVKYVMDQLARGTLRGVHGPMGALCEVPGQYALAIEVALGGALQHLIVETQESGKAVLQELKRRDIGRVTCLPLDAVRGTKLNTKEFAGVPGYLGLAADMLRYDARYAGIVAQLLGKVVVVSDLDSGIAMARRFGNRLRIVTIDGQLLSPGGAMTGGAVNHKGGILSRAGELDDLRARLLEQEAALETQQVALSKWQSERAHVRSACATLEQAQHAGEQTLTRLLAEQREKQARAAEVGRRLAAVQAELATLADKTEEGHRRAAEARDRIAKLSQLSDQLTAREVQLEQTLQENEAAREALMERQRTQRTRLAVLAAETRAALQAQNVLDARRAALTQTAQSRTAALLRLDEEEAERARELQTQQAQLVDLEEEKTQAEAFRVRLGEEKLALEKERAQAERESRELGETLLREEKEALLSEQRKLSAEQEEAQLLGALWDQYELSHEAARALQRPIPDRRQAERRIGALKQEIRSLGQVNLGAVEEYDRLYERHSYLEEQKADVEEADRALVKIIDELLAEMKSIFHREFLRIDRAFRETMRELFGGGSAALLLEDERDLLNCGIEIRVQPPGKTVRSLSLLSGGEKAFVAIALYFAILKIRPTPFCVLDEIEAALDDANVQRFASYLRRMADKTQFIVITHRRGTMEEADLLYGVTMERQGISRMLCLHLNEATLGLGLSKVAE